MNGSIGKAYDWEDLHPGRRLSCKKGPMPGKEEPMPGEEGPTLRSLLSVLSY